jgi:hypothetical protein
MVTTLVTKRTRQKQGVLLLISTARPAARGTARIRVEGRSAIIYKFSGILGGTTHARENYIKKSLLDLHCYKLAGSAQFINPASQSFASYLAPKISEVRATVSDFVSILGYK